MIKNLRTYSLAVAGIILAGCSTLPAPISPVTPVSDPNLGQALAQSQPSTVQVGVVETGQPLFTPNRTAQSGQLPVVRPTVTSVANADPQAYVFSPAAPLDTVDITPAPTVKPVQQNPAVEEKIVDAAPPPAAIRDNLGEQKQKGDALASLLDKAADAVGSGNLDQAASALEQALRVEPNNASTWHDLAQVRMHQKQFNQAEAMAKKSINFAGSKSLKSRNWRLIAVARRAQGDESGAQEADAKAAAFE